MQALTRLQQRIGYQFKQISLLEQAVTHKSYGGRNNERLEFVGDAVLGYLVGNALFQRYGDVQEDALSLMRANLVQGATLAEIAREIGLADCLRLGEGERKSGGRKRASILADAFEAVLGAVHEEAGIETCRALVEHLFGDRIARINDHNLAHLKDAKTQLQEYLQGRSLGLPVYRVQNISGADHDRTYTVECEVAELQLTCTASAGARRAAEKLAAEIMLTTLGNRESE